MLRTAENEIMHKHLREIYFDASFQQLTDMLRKAFRLWRVVRGLNYRPLHKWRLNLNNNTYTSLASHSCENLFVLKHQHEAKDVQSTVIQI